MKRSNFGVEPTSMRSGRPWIICTHTSRVHHSTSRASRRYHGRPHTDITEISSTHHANITQHHAESLTSCLNHMHQAFIVRIMCIMHIRYASRTSSCAHRTRIKPRIEVPHRVCRRPPTRCAGALSRTRCARRESPRPKFVISCFCAHRAISRNIEHLTI